MRIRNSQHQRSKTFTYIIQFPLFSSSCSSSSCISSSCVFHYHSCFPLPPVIRISDARCSCLYLSMKTTAPGSSPDQHRQLMDRYRWPDEWLDRPDMTARWDDLFSGVWVNNDGNHKSIQQATHLMLVFRMPNATTATFHIKLAIFVLCLKFNSSAVQSACRYIGQVLCFKHREYRQFAKWSSTTK